MSDVKSKNLYELLGNTSDQDSDREPEPPTKAVDKTAPRSGKRDAPKSAPVAPAAANAGSAPRGGGNRRAGGFTGNEAAFRDRATGRTYNRDKPTGEEGTEAGVRPGRDSGPGVRRGGRGPRGPRRGGDRHSRTGITEHQKQTDQAWGGNTGEGEWADERAGEAIAKEEVKEGGFDAVIEAPVDAEGNTPAPVEEEQEPEDTSKSYATYLAEQAAKKLEGLGLKEARQANDGSDNKKWANAKPLAKEGEDEYFAGQEKQRRERERTSKKQLVDVDYSFKEPPRESRDGPRGRGGRGRGRGGRGDFDGERGRGRGRGRGGPDGAAPRGRGRGGADGAAVAINDEQAFPSLGA